MRPLGDVVADSQLAKSLALMASAGIVRATTGKRRDRRYAYARYLALLDQGTKPLVT